MSFYILRAGRRSRKRGMWTPSENDELAIYSSFTEVTGATCASSWEEFTPYLKGEFRKRPGRKLCDRKAMLPERST